MNQAASSSEVNLSIEHGLPIAGHSRLTKVESKYSAQTLLAARPSFMTQNDPFVTCTH